MFDQLLESRRHRERSTRQALASIAVHTAIIAVSIQLTRAVAATVTKSPVQPEMYLARPPAPRTERAPANATSESPVAPRPIAAPATVPLVLPTDLPSIAPARGFDPSRFGLPGDTHRLLGSGDDSASGDRRMAASSTEVDEPVQYLDGPIPKYPAALRQVGIEGWVQLRYVVGVDGKVERTTVQAVASSNPAFEQPAIDAITAARFAPARIRGRKVRQLVEQTVRFALH